MRHIAVVSVRVDVEAGQTATAPWPSYDWEPLEGAVEIEEGPVSVTRFNERVVEFIITIFYTLPDEEA